MGNTSRLNLSNFLFDNRNSSSIFTGINAFAAAYALKDLVKEEQNLPSLSRGISLPFGGLLQDQAGLMSYKSGIMDMNELFNELDMG